MTGRRISSRGRITYFDPSDPHGVYRIFDRLNRVIYIGSSHAPVERIETHRSEAKWRGEVFRWEEEWFNDRASANKAEHLAVWREDPDHNFVGTPLSAIISRSRFGPDGWDAADRMIAEARAHRAARIVAEKAGDPAAAREANAAFAAVAAKLGVPNDRVQQIAEGRTAGGQGGGAAKPATTD